MMFLLTALFALAAAQDLPPTAPEAPVADAPTEAAPENEADTDANADEADTETDDVEADDADDAEAEATEAAEAEPWSPPAEADRYDGEAPLTGPWPDGWAAPSEEQRQDLVDPLTDEVMEAGVPVFEGEMEGPAPIDNLETSPVDDEPLGPEEPPTDGEGDHGEGDRDDVAHDDVAHGEIGADEPAEDHGESPVEEHAPPNLAVVEELLPVPRFTDPPSDALGFIFLALGVGLLASFSDRLQARLPERGLLPSLFLFTSGFGRLLAALLVITAVLVGATGTWLNVVPYILVGAGLALGWSVRDTIRDIVAGGVLAVESSMEVGDRIRFGEIEGVISALGPRSARVIDDKGHTVSVPNRLLMERSVAVDVNPFAHVDVLIHVPPGVPADQIHQVLTELALLSPYLAPAHDPHVYRDPSAPDVWILEARLVSPLYSRDFRGAMVELAEETLGHPSEHVSS